MFNFLKKLLKIGLILLVIIIILSIIFPDDADQTKNGETSPTDKNEVSNSDLSTTDSRKSLKIQNDVITGKYIASDPAILKDGNLYRIYYTCLLPPERTAICQKISYDGINWENIPGTRDEKVVLQGVNGEWDENLETPFVMKKPNGEYLLYYGGYTDAFELFKGDGAAIGLATSQDGVNFTKVGSVLSPTPGGYDNDAAYSPAIIFDEKTDNYFMVYASHSYCSNCPVGNRILSARSSDGYTWEKDSKPLLESGGSPIWMREGVAEPDIIKHGNEYILFLTGLNGEDRSIGYATSNSLTKGYRPKTNPVIVPDRHDLVLAPSVLFEDDIFKVWYLSAKGDALSISYQELDL